MFLLSPLLQFHCGIKPVPQVIKVNKVKILYLAPQFLFVASIHPAQTKPFARVEDTLFFALTACTHLSHFEHSSKFAITLLPHLVNGSTMLLSIPFFEPLIFTSFLRLTYSPLLSGTLFHFINFSIKLSILLFIRTKASAYKILFIKTSLAYSVTTSTAVTETKVATQILDVPQVKPQILYITLIPLLTFVFTQG